MNRFCELCPGKIAMLGTTDSGQDEITLIDLASDTQIVIAGNEAITALIDAVFTLGLTKEDMCKKTVRMSGFQAALPNKQDAVNSWRAVCEQPYKADSLSHLAPRETDVPSIEEKEEDSNVGICQLLVAIGAADSLEDAANAILEGNIYLDGVLVSDPSEYISKDLISGIAVGI